MKEFTRGQKSKLADLTPATKLQVGLNIEAAGSIPFDISCFGVDANDKLSDDRYFIFYNQKTSPCGSLSAQGPQDGNRENFQVDLSQLPASIRKLVFTVTIDGAGTMSQTTYGHLRLYGNGSEVAKFVFSGRDFKDEKAVIVGEIYLKDVWRFAAVGQGFNGGLSALLKHFGGEEAGGPAPTPTPYAPPPPTPPRPAPPAPPPVNLGKVTLDKKGDKKVVNLQKGGSQPIHINLNWDNPFAGQRRGLFARQQEAPDLDLGCMYRMRDGRKGVIQSLSRNFGSRDQYPYIFLDKDDRSGAASDGENLFIYRPDLIDLVLVITFIYEGANDFTQVNGRLTITDQARSEIFMRLNSPDYNKNFCAICTIRGTGSTVEITKEEQYFFGHEDADRRYGFGFRWVEGSK